MCEKFLITKNVIIFFFKYKDINEIIGLELLRESETVFATG